MLPNNFDQLPVQIAEELANISTLIEVYVDNYIACIDEIKKEHITQVSHAMLHGIHSVFPLPDQTGHNGGFQFLRRSWTNWKCNGTI